MIAIRKFFKDFALMVGLAVVALGVGGYILSQQRFYLPHWVPLVGSDFVTLKAEMTTAQSVTPGQGQVVTIAGVPVGEISSVDLVHGRAVVSMRIRRKYFSVYRDASALLRPKTGLNDMLLELTPGHPSSGRVPEGWTLPLNQTLPNINADEVLSALDADTRDYLRVLLGAGGQGLGGQGRALSAVFRRFDPTSRDLERITHQLSARHANIARTIHNFRLLTEALGSKDTQLSSLVDSSNAVFGAFARQDASLRATLAALPGALSTTNTALGKTDRLARVLGPTLQGLRPAARALGPSLAQTRPFLRATTPVIRDQLRPFSRAALPVIRELRPTAHDLASVIPNLRKTFNVVNYLLNELAYNPPGGDHSYLYWVAWANHAGASVFSTQDAHGPIRHGLFLVSCSSLGVLATIVKANPQLGTLTQLLNAPQQSAVCPKPSGPGNGLLPGGGR
ncbi:MAG TPA: MlaD family protein [Solirubrobacteraceae bacterium]|jgi:phospholipid/cholesterol/gamma-HCH transport system substrate-binding protein|nr:MlaD family protein [Solirubrobacteraceae bacterium]